MALPSGGEGNLFGWNPLNFWRPDDVATAVGGDLLIRPALIGGQYLLMVQAETDMTYTLTTATDIPPGFAAKQMVAEAVQMITYAPSHRPNFWPVFPSLLQRHVFLPIVR